MYRHAALTLGIQEVGYGYSMTRVWVYGSVFEHLLDMTLRADAHILLTKRPHMVPNVRIFLIMISKGHSKFLLSIRLLIGEVANTYKLLRQRDFLELHLVQPGGG